MKKHAAYIKEINGNEHYFHSDEGFNEFMKKYMVGITYNGKQVTIKMDSSSLGEVSDSN